jgi:amino acid transporter
MGNNTSVQQHTKSDAIALGRSSTDSSAWFSGVFAVIFIFASLILLMFFIMYPSFTYCVSDSDCDDDDTCNKSRNHCTKKKRNIGYIIGFIVCLIIGILLIFSSMHNFKMLNDDQYLRGVGERIYQQQAIDRAEAPYLAAGEAGAMILDASNNKYNNGFTYGFR